METESAESHVNPDGLREIVQERGVLAHRGGEGAIDFQFNYLGFPFAVRAEAGTHGATVNIRAVLGYLPYTAESRSGRLGVMQIIEAASQAMGQRVRLGEKQRLIMSDKRTTNDALTPVNLMALMVGMLLEAKPYLQLLVDYMTPVKEGEAPDAFPEISTESPIPNLLPAE